MRRAPWEVSLRSVALMVFLSGVFALGVFALGAFLSGVIAGACRARIQVAKPGMSPVGFAEIYSSQLDNKGITEAAAIIRTSLV